MRHPLVGPGCLVIDYVLPLLREVPQEMIVLAKKAAENRRAEPENVEEWAKKIADDVSNAND